VDSATARRMTGKRRHREAPKENARDHRWRRAHLPGISKLETTASCEYWVTGSHCSAQFAAGFVLRTLRIVPTPTAAVCRRSGGIQDSSD
jgi:hypothetical protein